MLRYLPYQQGDTNGKILNINKEILMVKYLNINREILMVRYLSTGIY